MKQDHATTTNVSISSASGNLEKGHSMRSTISASYLAMPSNEPPLLLKPRKGNFTRHSSSRFSQRRLDAAMHRPAIPANNSGWSGETPLQILEARTNSSRETGKDCFQTETINHKPITRDARDAKAAISGPNALQDARTSADACKGLISALAAAKATTAKISSATRILNDSASVAQELKFSCSRNNTRTGSRKNETPIR